jgi:hypothetical protein
VKKLVPYEQRIVQKELDRLRADKDWIESSSNGAPAARSVSKTNIDQLREHSAGILTGKVNVE